MVAPISASEPYQRQNERLWPLFTGLTEMSLSLQFSNFKNIRFSFLCPVHPWVLGSKEKQPP